MKVEKVERLNYMKMFILRAILEVEWASFKDIKPRIASLLSKYNPKKTVSKRYVYRCISELVDDQFLILRSRDAIKVWQANPIIKPVLFSYIMAFFGLLEIEVSTHG